MLSKAGDERTGGGVPLLQVNGLKKHFALRRSLGERLVGRARAVSAIDGVDFSIFRGETLGVIGESGCGKTTLGRTVLQLVAPSAGSVLFGGVDLAKLAPTELKRMRRRMQIVFQDPHSSLNPRKTIRTILRQPLEIHEPGNPSEFRKKVSAITERVGLREFQLDRYPHQFSGGQRQRIGIARALILNPEFVVCDEPVSALDVSIQAQILSLLQELKEALNLTLLFISHDLAVIATLSDRIAVMYLGKIVELGAAKAVITQPAHPYTQALLQAAPRLDRGAAARKPAPPLELPSQAEPPPGCKFHPRCPHAMKVCREVAPATVEIAPGHGVSCHLYGPS